MAKTPTWQRAEGKNPNGGLNEKGRASLKAEGHDIKRPQPEGGSRRDSFCARMKGMKKKLTSAETANDPDSRINKSLRAWNCADGGAVDPYDEVQRAAKADGGIGLGDPGSTTRLSALERLKLGAQNIFGPKQEWQQLQDQIRSSGMLTPNPHGQPYTEAVSNVKTMLGYPAIGQPFSYHRLNDLPLGEGSWKQTSQTQREYTPASASPMPNKFPISKQDEAQIDRFTRHEMEGATPWRQAGEPSVMPTTPLQPMNVPVNGVIPAASTRFMEMPLKAQAAMQSPVTRGRIEALSPYGETGFTGRPVYESGVNRDVVAADPTLPAAHTPFGAQIPWEQSHWAEGMAKNSGSYKELPQREWTSQGSTAMRGHMYGYGALDPNVPDPNQARVETQQQIDNILKDMQGKQETPDTPSVDNAPEASAPDPYEEVARAAGGQIWDKPRPKKLGKPEPLSPKEKSSAKAAAKAAGRPYPNLIDNMRAARADGGEVIGDKVQGDVQFLEDDPYAKVQDAAKLPMMAQNDFAMRMPEPEVRYDTGPQPGEATLKAYEPTIREQIAQKLMGNERPSPERQQFVQGMMGTTGIGQHGMGVADFVPVAGQALQAQESYQHRDPKGFLLATVPVPGANIESKIAQGVAAAAERAMVGESAQQMTKSQSQAAMKQAWEAGQGNADKYRNWQHQWNVEQSPQYAVQQAIQASPPAIGHNMPPEPIIPADYNRIVNPAGFYSLGHEVAMTQLPETVRTWQEMQSLLKQGGVKDEEMKWAGLLNYDPRQKVSREEIAQAFERNFPQVEEVWKRNPRAVSKDQQMLDHARLNEELASAEQAREQANRQLIEVGTPDQYGRILFNVRNEEPIAINEVRHLIRSGNLNLEDFDENARPYIQSYADAYRRYNDAYNRMHPDPAETSMAIRPKWEKYTHPGGTNYSESILRLPYNNPSEIRNIHPEIEAKYSDEQAALKEKLFNLKESRDAQASHDIQRHNEAVQAYKQKFYERALNDAINDGMEPERAMAHARKFTDNTPAINMENYLGERAPSKSDFASQRFKQLNYDINTTREEIGALTNKMLDETRAMAGHPAYTQQVYRHETHLGDIDNPLLHQRWKERVGPEGERILSNEEFQSDLGQEGADKGFKDPSAQRKRADLERQRKSLEDEWGSEKEKLNQQFNAEIAPIMQQKRAEIKQVTDAYNQTRQLRSEFDAYNDQLAAIDDKYAPLLQPYKDKLNAAGQDLVAKYKPISKSINDQLNALPKQGDIPLFPHVGTTDQWVELGAKHALQHALENGHDKIFIMGGQEQARRWQSGMRQAVEHIGWESNDGVSLRDLRAKQIYGRDAIYDELPQEIKNQINESINKSGVPYRTVYAKPTSGDLPARFVVDKEGSIIDSTMSEAKGKKLKDAVGGDLAKRIMGEESGDIPMKDYIMGAEGYTHHYERKIPSIYKDIIKKYLKVDPKVESGKLLERAEAKKIGPLAQRALSEAHSDIPAWGRVEPQGNDTYRVVFPDGSFRGGYGREAAEQIVERARNRAEASGLPQQTQQAQQPAQLPAIEGPHGTYIHITPEMREAYQRIKKQRGSVFPGYADGGAVSDEPKQDPYEAVQRAAMGDWAKEEANKPSPLKSLMDIGTVGATYGLEKARERMDAPLEPSRQLVEKSVVEPAKSAYHIAAQSTGEEPYDPYTAIQNAANVAGALTLGAGAFERPTGSLAMGASRVANDTYEAAMKRAQEQGYTGPWYHGTNRIDRLLEGKGLNPKRATSGPMPYFTDNPEIASNYAKGKADTSLVSADTGNVADYFTVHPKSLGWSGRSEIPVERTWNYLPREVRQDILSKAKRIGYANPDQATGNLMLHPEGVEATLSPSHYDWVLKNEARGNPLAALREMWHDSGELVGREHQLEDVFRLAGYPHPISQKNAPWTEAQGVLPAMLRMVKPLNTESVDEINEKVIPALEQAFKKDRTRTKSYGADQWDKNLRFTPKQWVNQLKQDMATKDNSYVWTSIPDKVTKVLKELGYDGIIDTGGKSGGGEHRVAIPFGPHQVRSKFAKFNPKHLGSPDLLKSEGGEVVNKDDTYDNIRDASKNFPRARRASH